MLMTPRRAFVTPVTQAFNYLPFDSTFDEAAFQTLPSSISSMPTINNLSVWVEVEGKRLPEHGVQSSASGNQLIRTCWIPSEAGKVRFFSYISHHSYSNQSLRSLKFSIKTLCGKLPPPQGYLWMVFPAPGVSYLARSLQLPR